MHEITRETILENAQCPAMLEEMYHRDKTLFAEIIATLHDENVRNTDVTASEKTQTDENSLLIAYWHARLFYKQRGTDATVQNPVHNPVQYALSALLIIFAWIPVRIYVQESVPETKFLTYLIPIVISFALSVYFLLQPVTLKTFFSGKLRGLLALTVIHALVYLYLVLLPDSADTVSQSLQNAFYFVFVLLWFFMFAAYSRFKLTAFRFENSTETSIENSIEKPLGEFIVLSGEVIIWSTLFLLGGVVVVWLSGKLFDSIGIDVWLFYAKNVITLGVVASPFVSLLVIEKLHKLKLSGIIANIFLPLVLATIFAFAIASIFTETKPYEDRSIFVLYNVMLVVVVCVLVFTSITDFPNKFIAICALILPAITIVLDGVTISAVIYRLTQYGISPNKITLLGTNIIMLAHLLYILYLRIKKNASRNVRYLLLYALWALCVVFVFPFAFKFA
ncbi:MAG: DUF4153 domain-containing protein [Treponemataceae bacterium]|nr:MAG: DUF4153 domain-containing protein [Treponemataceae bacterium]